MDRIGLAEQLAAAIIANLDDHMGVDPEHVQWGHVGNVNHVIENLLEVADFMGIEYT